jgi:kynurenine formamidase
MRRWNDPSSKRVWPTSAELMTMEQIDFRAVGQQVSNWGRWGDEDERGTVNLITPQHVAAAATLVRHGKVFDLGIELGPNGPQAGGARINPMHLMSATGSESKYPDGFRVADDYIFMPLQAAAQYDSLAHVHYDGLLYNGFAADSITTAGAAHCSIDKLGPGIAGRGVLLDVARLNGVDWLESGHAITPADLDAAAERQAVEVMPGDILLVRTGWRKMLVSSGDRAAFMAGEPGLAFECVEWLRAHDVALIGADNWAVEVYPTLPNTPFLGLHMVAIRDIGLTLAEMLDFEALSADCASDGVWEFMFAGPPLKFTAAVGTTVNPLAIK